jgi:hypothetical protein
MAINIPSVITNEKMTIAHLNRVRFLRLIPNSFIWKLYSITNPELNEAIT